MSLGPVLAALPRSLAAAAVHDRARGVTVVAVEAVDAVPTGTDPFVSFDTIAGGWWAGYLAYEAGHRIEHVDGATPADVEPVPEHRWLRFGVRAELDGAGHVRWFGRGAARRALERALDAPRAVAPMRPTGDWSTSLDRFDFELRVRAVEGLVRAGTCYQVNLTRRLCGAACDPVALWHACERGNPAPHAHFWRDEAGLAVVGASPERFLGISGSSVTTEPIKGTGRSGAALVASEKDRAENVMIVDLARNDLGRVCVPGSIRVPRLCRVESHPGLVHLVSTVTGTRRTGVGLGALLRATFPPASITGAPKPRVMQAIRDLEPVPRDVYCGATGWHDADRDRADLAVAIRTFTCTPHTTSFGVGAGITIDSDPAAEWAETELKSRRLLALAGRAPTRPSAVPVPGRGAS